MQTCALAGEKHGDVRRQRALAASALRIQYHYVAHNPPTLCFCGKVEPIAHCATPRLPQERCVLAANRRISYALPMRIEFLKMQGLGNDFLVFDAPASAADAHLDSNRCAPSPIGIPASASIRR
jgi:hypothetical protein